MILGEFGSDPVLSLEHVRLKLCANRRKPAGGDRYWATARDNAVELQRLGYIKAMPLPKDRRAYENSRENKLKVTTEGEEMLGVFKANRAEAYDQLFIRMFSAHPYLQTFVSALVVEPIRAPVITSAKDHVSHRYATAAALAEDVSKRTVDVEGLFQSLGKRLRRALSPEETARIRDGVWKITEAWAGAAGLEEAPAFARKFLQKLNDVVLPVILRPQHLTFDFKTHQTLWSFGREWKLWESTARHPDWDLRIVFPTASIHLGPNGNAVKSIAFDRGLQKTGERFLQKLYAAYQKLQQKGRGTFSSVDELRAVFCYDNACQESVFDRLVAEHYEGSTQYEINMEIFRKSTQHDRPIRIGNRNIGLIRVIPRATAN